MGEEGGIGDGREGGDCAANGGGVGGEAEGCAEEEEGGGRAGDRGSGQAAEAVGTEGWGWGGRRRRRGVEKKRGFGEEDFAGFYVASGCQRAAAAGDVGEF